MIKTRQEKLAWLAGLFEGEATFGLQWTNKRKNRMIACALVMSDLDVVQRAGDLIREFGFDGIIDGPYRQKKSKKPLYRWRLRGSRLRKGQFLETLLPFMLSRRAIRIAESIEFSKLPITRGGAKLGEVRHLKPYAFISPSGLVVEGFNLSDFCRQRRLNYDCMNRLKNKKLNTHRGWKRKDQ